MILTLTPSFETNRTVIHLVLSTSIGQSEHFFKNNSRGPQHLHFQSFYFFFRLLKKKKKFMATVPESSTRGQPCLIYIVKGKLAIINYFGGKKLEVESITRFGPSE